MNEIAYFDLEVDPQNGRLLDIGCVRSGERIFHGKSIPEFLSFITGSDFLCGHNIFQHDLKHIQKYTGNASFGLHQSIDTLLLSPLLFPKHPYHHLTKDDKLQSEERNNPVSDAKKARELLMDEVAAFAKLPEAFKIVLFELLHEQTEFACFFKYIKYSVPDGVIPLEQRIKDLFKEQICEHADIIALVKDPIPLAYALSLIRGNDTSPAWVLMNYPQIQQVGFLLRSVPCTKGCDYCRKAMEPLAALERYFGLTRFRVFGDIPLQEEAVQTALRNRSLLTIFPTGGGKSITFQLPALMSGEISKALTVVISPLQSLMKDQVDGLEKKHHVTGAVTINGLLSQIERSQAIQQVEEGRASLLYIAPESLRSLSIERLLMKREISRFVIDEAHCFSAWGQDFRVDYLYIGEFIRTIQEKKQLLRKIPVSCFTATAKQKVIEDIRQYFKDRLDLQLELFRADTARPNLHYSVRETKNEDEKNAQLRALIQAKPCPVIVYVARTKKADELARKLSGDGFPALAFHGKMDKDQKTANQNEFMEGKANIMVATSAFGMGVDKADVGMVIHYNISDSLENYIQEAGRAGRNDSLSADCHILFDEEDLDRHFILHNQTKLSVKEIKQVYKAVKELTQIRNNASYSALEIARKAGWDEQVRDIETRITTTIAALEEAKYVKRGRNYPWVYANSILAQNAQEAIDKISASPVFATNDQKGKAIRIIKRLFSSKSKGLSTDEQAESRVDYLADQLGMSREEVIRVVTLLKDQQILADTKDIRVFIKKGEKRSQSLPVLESYMRLEQELWEILTEEENAYHLKELNTTFQNKGVPDCSPKKIRTVINFWAIKGWIHKRNHDHSGNHLQLRLAIPRKEFGDRISCRHYLSAFTIRFLFQKTARALPQAVSGEGMQIEFSVLELKEEAEREEGVFGGKFSIDDIEDTLFYLSRIDVLRIDGGFMVTYNRLSIERLEWNNNKQYTVADYKQLERHYLHKVQQIHIVGEYAKKMIRSEKEALKFASDYFNLDFTVFLKKYFPGSRQTEIGRTLTPGRFRRLFGDLSPRQMEIIDDAEHDIIVVAAGPGSGKTKILVHKLASLLLFEDVKPEQLLMLTFSRAAATEFKERLLDLVGEAAPYVEVKTFHSYCFDLLGRVGNIGQSDDVVKETVDRVRSNDVEKSRITKTVLVIDEAQDMDVTQFQLVQALMEQNEDMRLILVGDDDQNIFAFRGASSIYMQHFANMEGAITYQLTENFRSGREIVSFANQWASRIIHRLKTQPGVSGTSLEDKVSLVAYQSPHLIVPVSLTVKNAGLSGSTGVLVRTNEEAVQLTAVFRQLGLKAELIQDDNMIRLASIYELRALSQLLRQDERIPRIDQAEWERAVQQFSTIFQASSRRELVLAIARRFAAIHPRHKYYSDWITFIRESHIEDFADTEQPAIYVSTIHKTKGKQFDNVFLMLNGFKPSTDEDKRLFYVAITRPKTHLAIHYNGNYLLPLASETIDHSNDEQHYPEPAQLAFMLTHQDVYLGYFSSVQDQIDGLHSGDRLLIREYGLTNTSGQLVVKFSKKFMEELITRRQQGYKPLEAHVSFIIYWVDRDTNKECKIVLPEVLLAK
jgi:ATP-dependent DNA helicase RecQ